MKAFAIAASAVAALALAPVAHAATVIVDFTDAIGLGIEGKAGNTIITRELGAGSRVTGIFYETTIETRNHRWLRDQHASFGTSESSWVNLQPGFDAMWTGKETFSGAYDLTDLGVDFGLLDDGILKIEFHDNFNQDAEAFGKWTDGRFTITYDAIASVPETGTWVMMILGMGAIGASMRFRRGRLVAHFA